MYCTNCGRKIPDDAKYCLHCGNPLRTEQAPINPESQTFPPKKPMDKKPSSLLIAVLAAIIVMIAVIVLVVLRIGSDTIQPASENEPQIVAENSDDEPSAAPDTPAIVGNYHFYKGARDGAIQVKDDSFIVEEDRKEDPENTISITYDNGELAINKNAKFLRTYVDMAEEETIITNVILSRYMQDGDCIYPEPDDFPLTLTLNSATENDGESTVYYIGDDNSFMDEIYFEGDYLIVSNYTFEAYELFYFIKD